MRFYDCHIHTNFSHDSEADPNLICAFAIKNRVKAIAFTDHFDIEFQNDRDFYSPIANSVDMAKKLNAFYRDKLLVLKGVEYSSPLFNPQIPRNLIKSFDFDLVIGSIHSVFSAEDKRPYSHINFDLYDDNAIKSYLMKYFEELLDLVVNYDFDILAHISCPLRYFKQKVEISEFKPILDEILTFIIKRDLSLEANSKSIFNQNSLDYYALKRFHELGGKKISLGSDSHFVESVANKFPETIDLLTGIGFKEACYFVNRKPIFYNL